MGQSNRRTLHLAVDPGPTGPDDRATVLRRLQQSELFREYQQAFEATMGLPLVLRAAGSFRPPLQGSKHVNAFCALMTRASATCAACLQVQQRLEETATQGAKTMECYAGLSESVVPVLVGDQVLGYLQTGQVLLRAASRARFKVLVRTLPGGATAINSAARETAYFKTRVITPKQYQMILRLLGVFAGHLGAVSNQLLIGQTAADPPMITKLRAFIAAHHREPLSLHDAARVAYTSPYHLCRIFKGATGLTFTGYLARVRIESAKRQLLVSGVRVSEAAFAAGFQSLSQFNRQFRRIAGETPSLYRDRQQEVNPTAVRPGNSASSFGRNQPMESFHRPQPASLRALCG